MRIRTGRRYYTKNIRIGAGVMIVLFILWAAAFATNNGLTVQSESHEETEKELTSLQVLEKPENYYGKTITISGQIDRINSSRVFVVDQIPYNYGDEMLVVSRKDILPTGAGYNLFQVEEDSKITGTVTKLKVREIERKLKLNLEPELEKEFKNLPILVATDVEISDQATIAQQ